MLKIENLSFQYPTSASIFSEFNLELASHGLFQIKGENGSGKTTLLKLITGLILPQQGSIRFDNSALTLVHTNFLSANETAFFDQMTGEEGLELFAKLNKSELMSSQAGAFLENPLVQKIKGRQFHQMSSGMKRLFLLMACFTKEAKIYLLDEPFVGMDAQRKELVAHILNQISQNTLILFSSHEKIEALSVTKDIVLTGEGNV